MSFRLPDFNIVVFILVLTSLMSLPKKLVKRSEFLKFMLLCIIYGRKKKYENCLHDFAIFLRKKVLSLKCVFMRTSNFFMVYILNLQRKTNNIFQGRTFFRIEALNQLAFYGLTLYRVS